MKLGYGLLGASAALIMSAFGASEAQDTKQSDRDDRTPVVVMPVERNYILGQMRLFVVSVQTIAAGLGANDLAQASEAATARGFQRNANDPAFPPTLNEKLPPQWKQLGGGMRKGFDVLAQTISAGGDPRKPLEQLGIVMTNCVACHATYRVTTAGN